MAYTAKITYGDDSSIFCVYRLTQIAEHLRKLKKEDVTVSYNKTMALTPWLIAMAFDDAIIYKGDSPVKCIEIQERVNV